LRHNDYCSNVAETAASYENDDDRRLAIPSRLLSRKVRKSAIKAPKHLSWAGKDGARSKGRSSEDGVFDRA
jgi:hypothetical protein